jgi:K+-transporting ATPase KdpF subunit
MTFGYRLGLVVSLLVAAYLAYALLRPETF